MNHLVLLLIHCASDRLKLHRCFLSSNVVNRHHIITTPTFACLPHLSPLLPLSSWSPIICMALARYTAPVINTNEFNEVIGQKCLSLHGHNQAQANCNYKPFDFNVHTSCMCAVYYMHPVLEKERYKESEWTSEFQIPKAMVFSCCTVGILWICNGWITV